MAQQIQLAQPALVSLNQKSNTRIVAECFNKSHQHILRSVRGIMSDTGEWGASNFGQTPYVDPQNGQTYQMYELTRDGFALLVMGFTGKKAMEWKVKFLAAFNAMEAQLKQPAIPDLNDPNQLRGLLSNYAERTEIAEAKLIEALPTIEAYDRLATSDGSMCFRDAAKTLQIRPIDLTKYLSQNGWIYRQGQKGPWLGYQSRITTGLLEHKVTTIDRSDGTDRITTQCRVTPKGITKLAALLELV